MEAKSTPVSLGERFERFTQAQVASGAYGSVSEVVQAGLLMLEEREARIAALRNAIREGEESGPATPFEFASFLSQMRANHKSDA